MPRKAQKEVFQVKTILDYKKIKNIPYYLIEWEGYPISKATWEPRSSFLNPNEELKNAMNVAKELFLSKEKKSFEKSNRKQLDLPPKSDTQKKRSQPNKSMRGDIETTKNSTKIGKSLTQIIKKRNGLEQVEAVQSQNKKARSTSSENTHSQRNTDQKTSTEQKKSFDNVSLKTAKTVNTSEPQTKEKVSEKNNTQIENTSNKKTNTKTNEKPEQKETVDKEIIKKKNYQNQTMNKQSEQLDTVDSTAKLSSSFNMSQIEMSQKSDELPLTPSIFANPAKQAPSLSPTLPVPSKIKTLSIKVKSIKRDPIHQLCAILIVTNPNGHVEERRSPISQVRTEYPHELIEFLLQRIQFSGRSSRTSLESSTQFVSA